MVSLYVGGGGYSIADFFLAVALLDDTFYLDIPYDKNSVG